MKRRIAVVIAMLVAAGFGIGLAGVRGARGATTNRAAVVVEVDGAIHTAKVTFTSDSISGLDALRDAGFAPTVRVFGGNGGAVCALDVGGTTIGCPADNTCLTCSADSDYWAYWRALPGATRYTYSPAGASSTQVRDGDVEAWNWGTGAAPSPFVSFADVWAPTPTTTRPPATTTPQSPSTSPPPGGPPGPLGPLDPLGSTAPPPPTGHAGTPTSASPRVPAAPTSTDARTTTSRATETSVRAADRSSSRKVATAPVVAHGGGGSSWGLVGFAAIIVVLLGAIVVARLRRRSSPAAS